MQETLEKLRHHKCFNQDIICFVLPAISICLQTHTQSELYYVISHFIVTLPYNDIVLIKNIIGSSQEQLVWVHAAT